MKTLLYTLALRITVLTLMFAFATSGFAHRFVSPDDTATLRAAAELGFSPSDLCGDTDEGQIHQRGCEACLLASGCAMPPADFAFVAFHFGTTVLLSKTERIAFFSRNAGAAHRVRAPPIV